MNIAKINGQQVQFKRNDKNYENPISRRAEKNLAIWGSLCGSVVAGTIVGGIASSFKHPPMEKGSGFNGFMKAYKLSVIAGAIASAVYLAITLPAKIYNTKVNAFAKQKEMDVFSRDRSLKSNLTEEVDQEVQNPDVSLDKKLDDNLKLQMANRGAAIGIANVTAQSQG